MDATAAFMAAFAAARTVAPPASAFSAAGGTLLAPAKLLLADLERGPIIDAPTLRAAMSATFSGSDSEGAWAWKIAYDACEAAQLQSIRIPESQAHPTRLVQSDAMISVAPPKPSYRPHLPAAVISDSFLSDAQLESVIYAGMAYAGFLDGAWTVVDTFDVVSAAPDAPEGAVGFRRGWFLGYGAGAGKGRQVAGIVLDNWLKGRRRAVWTSNSDKLIEDAQRDWSALGQDRLLITPRARFHQRTPIRLEHGVLFTTYATLRSDTRDEKVSRVQQLVDWLRRDFDGVIVFNESHAMQNATGEKSEGGERAPSQQGRAGLRLQHAPPDARVLYVSATRTTAVHKAAA